MNANELKKINDAISAYNKKQKANIPIDSDNNMEQSQTVELWTADDTFFEVFFKVGDSASNKVYVQNEKNRQYINLLANDVLNEFPE